MANVPRLPGVPSLPSFAGAAISLLLSDTGLPFAVFSAPQWGIYLNGVPAIVPSSIISFTYKQDWALPTYPVEQGGFQNYDKVSVPFESRIRVVSGGTAAERQSLVDQVQAIAGTLDLYDIVTPQQVYTSVNVTHFSYEQTAYQGVGMVVIDIWFVEIRMTSQATFSDTKPQSNAQQKNIGNVQPQTPSDRISQAFEAGNWKVQ